MQRAGTSLGWADNTSAKTVTIMSTHPADFNLDGNVDNTDKSIWFAHAWTGTTWAEGDANYDGSVDGLDRDLWMQHAYSSWASPAPAVMAISRMGANSTSASSVQFIVTFSQGVTDVDAGDFALACLGTSGTIASVVDCSQCHAVYIVTVDNVSGNGTLGLNLIDNNSIKDTNNVPLVGIGTDDGSFTGDVYTASSPFVWDGGGADNHWSTAANWARRCPTGR